MHIDDATDILRVALFYNQGFNFFFRIISTASFAVAIPSTKITFLVITSLAL